MGIFLATNDVHVFLLDVLGVSRIHIIVPAVTLFAGAIAGHEKERDKQEGNYER